MTVTLVVDAKHISTIHSRVLQPTRPAQTAPPKFVYRSFIDPLLADLADPEIVLAGHDGPCEVTADDVMICWQSQLPHCILATKREPWIKSKPTRAKLLIALLSLPGSAIPSPRSRSIPRWNKVIGVLRDLLVLLLLVGVVLGEGIAEGMRLLIIGAIGVATLVISFSLT